MTPRSRRAIWAGIGMSLGAAFGWYVGREKAQPIASIQGDNNVLIIISASVATDQPPPPASESLSGCASAMPTCRNAFWPDVSAPR